MHINDTSKSDPAKFIAQSLDDLKPPFHNAEYKLALRIFAKLFGTIPIEVHNKVIKFMTENS